MNKTVNRKELLYKYKGNTSDVDFSEYYGANDLIDKIKNGDVSLNEAVRRNKKRNLYKSRQAAISFFIKYTERVSEAKSRAKQEGTGLKILTPKQMLQRMPKALAQIKAGNNSKRLLNEIRQTVYSLYQSKEITKKVYNNIIKSIKV